MRIDWRTAPTDERRQLADFYLAAAVPAEFRAIAVFDNETHDRFPNPRYSCDWAFYMNIATGGVETISPQYMLELMESGDYDHVFWFSWRLMCCPLLQFVWIVEHEAQHFRQDRRHPELADSGAGVRCAIGRPCLQFEIPAELDAEHSAYTAVVGRFGGEAFDAYVAQEIAHSAKAKAYYEGLRPALRSYRGDWADLTRELLRGGEAAL